MSTPSEELPGTPAEVIAGSPQLPPGGPPPSELSGGRVLLSSVLDVVTGGRNASATDWFRFCSGWLACLALAATVGLLIVFNGDAQEKALARVALIGWTALPPVFFGSTTSSCGASSALRMARRQRSWRSSSTARS